MRKLSPVQRYYISKILRSRQGQLKSVVAEGAALIASPDADLDQVIESLYLDEPEIYQAVTDLETLVYKHQLLSGEKANVAEIERQIFWVLGLKPLA